MEENARDMTIYVVRLSMSSLHLRASIEIYSNIMKYKRASTHLSSLFSQFKHEY